MRLALGLFVILVGLGCGDATGPSPASVSGTWNLRSVNGSSLPFAVSDGLINEEITAGTLLVEPTNTFTYATTFQTVSNGQTATYVAADSGRYFISGPSVSFVFAGDGTTGTGVFSGDTVSLSAEGFSLVYTKQ